MQEIAPGSILQRMFFLKRIKSFLAANNSPEKRFVEIGTGKGANSNSLLELGMQGIGFDLNPDSCAQALANNKEYADQGKYEVRNEDFLTATLPEKVDLIFSCMVIEHLPEDKVKAYFQKCKEVLKPDGMIITLVPSSMKHWGIEDDIAGHFKRYSFTCFEDISKEHDLKIQEMSGLTYPLSNWILPLSNYLVNRSEGHKKELSLQEQTELSGNRDVKFKTVYPWYFRAVLNPYTLYPFYVLQRMHKKNDNSLVIYAELKLKS